MQKFLDNLSQAYYEGKPIVSDAEFDALADKYNYNEVGYSPTGGFKHLYPMFSLKKCFDMEEAPIPVLGTIESPKLDGAAVSLLYIYGELSLALTRGDGVTGQDITDKMKTLVPNTIPHTGLVQITGEVVAPKHIPNARNYASGALNLNSVDEFADRILYFIAYDSVPSSKDYWSEEMTHLDNIGFETVIHLCITGLPTDGVVYRIDYNREYAAAGYTSQHPKGAFAFKVQKAGVRTKLLDVIWQVGKSGVVSPVAILEPVKIGDATISKATLHNIEYIKALDLEVGCYVEVVRSGEIIPRILRRVD